MAEGKRKSARKSPAKKTTRKSSNEITASKIKAGTVTAAKIKAGTVTANQIAESSDAQSGPVRVPLGGIDPRLVEERERRREAEKGVRYARSSEPARLDPKLAEIRDATRKREAELSGRSLRKPPARG